IDVTHFLGQLSDVAWIAQVSGDKPRLSTRRVDLIDDGRPARCVAADDDDVHGVTCKPHGDFLAEPGGCARHECGWGLVVERGHGSSPGVREQNVLSVNDHYTDRSVMLSTGWLMNGMVSEPRHASDCSMRPASSSM